MSQWSTKRLGDVISLQRGYDLPEYEREPGSIPVYGSFGITGFHDKSRAPGCGVTIGRSGASFGVVNFSAVPYWPHNTVLFVTDFKGNDPRFVSYLLKTIDFSGFNSGSAQPSLNRNFLYPHPVLLPEVALQEPIADILSAYDDLIENNIRRINILEDVAMTIYREWFVNLRFPGRDRARMVESERGLLPEGWTVESLFDVANVTYGFPFKSNLFTSGGNGVPVIRIRDIKSERSNTRTTETVDRKYEVENGDLLVGMDGDFHMGKWAAGSAYLNQRVVRLRPKNDISSYFLFLALKTPIEHFDSTIVGTTVAHLSDRDLRSIKITIPDADILRKSSLVFEPLFELEIALKLKIANLRATRAFLLPKLVSGEIPVEASALLKEATA